jgi:hypothetical protein
MKKVIDWFRLGFRHWCELRPDSTFSETVQFFLVPTCIIGTGIAFLFRVLFPQSAVSNSWLIIGIGASTLLWLVFLLIRATHRKK